MSKATQRDALYQTGSAVMRDKRFDNVLERQAVQPVAGLDRRVRLR
jgi:hypothetical protein